MTTVQFSSRQDFEEQLQSCLARAQSSLRLFDADFALWNLGSSQNDAVLRHFLLAKGRIQLVCHDAAHLQLRQPRFMRLLADFGHLVECRLTPKNLRQLSDSFCIADGRDIVRRFHHDQPRGVAAIDNPVECQTSLLRFDTLWNEAIPGLHVTVSGL